MARRKKKSEVEDELVVVMKDSEWTGERMYVNSPHLRTWHMAYEVKTFQDASSFKRSEAQAAIDRGRWHGLNPELIPFDEAAAAAEKAA